ncbi:MAG: universal stress protein [Desulfurococcales archaeon]|nr:universal stress protein [Desulfurococcales archaeon]
MGGSEPLSKVLIPVDLSKSSDALIRYVATIKKPKFDIVLFHAIEESIVLHAGGGYDVTGLIRWLEDRAKAKIEEFKNLLEEAGFRVEVYPEMPVADPGGIIPEVAASINATEIFIASKGMGLARVIPLGSTINAVVKLSRVPVVRFKVFHDKKRDEASILGGREPFSKILVGVDVNVSKEMIEYSVRLASKVGGKVVYTHVIEHGESPPPQVKNAFRLADKLTSTLSVDSEFIVVSGHPPKVLLQLASHLEVTSILVGRTVTKTLGEIILGSTLDKLLKTSQLPLIVYPL